MKKKSEKKPVKKVIKKYTLDKNKTYDLLSPDFDTTTVYGKAMDSFDKKKKSSQIINDN